MEITPESLDPKDIYCVTIRVRPASRHPLFWVMQSAYLRIFCVAESPQLAGNRAVECLPSLSLELVGQRIKVHRPLGGKLPETALSRVVREKLDEVKQLGFSWL